MHHKYIPIFSPQKKKSDDELEQESDVSNDSDDSESGVEAIKDTPSVKRKGKLTEQQRRLILPTATVKKPVSVCHGIITYKFAS